MAKIKVINPSLIAQENLKLVSWNSSKTIPLFDLMILGGIWCFV